MNRIWTSNEAALQIHRQSWPPLNGVSVCLHSLPQLKSAVKAVEGGTPVVIANGTKGEGTILNIVSGKPVGTLVTSNGHSEVIVSAEQLADQGQKLFSFCLSFQCWWPKARSGSRALQTLSSDQRASILHHLATLLGEREKEIMAANQQDLEAARELSPPLRARLSLSPQRLASLADGLRQLAGTFLIVLHTETKTIFPLRWCGIM